MNASTPLFKHQDESMRQLLAHGGSGALLHDPGLGKTRTALEVFRRVREAQTKLLVICPLSIMRDAWENNIKTFTDFRFHNVHRDGWPTPDKLQQIDVLIINYESFIQDKNIAELMRITAAYPVMAVCDESSRMKSHTSKTTKTLMRLRDKFKYRIIMSGTPAPNSPLEYWGQFAFIDPHILGTSFHGFKGTYFHLERNGQMMNLNGQFMTREMMSKIFKQGFKWSITDANRRRLMERIAPHAHIARKANCLDLPAMIDQTREVTMGKNQRIAYNEMKRHLIAEINGKHIPAQNALTKLMKLRELTSGFAIDDLDQIVEVGENPKLDELMALVGESGTEQMIVWGNFKHEIKTITAALSAVAPTSTLYSETDSREDSIEAFLHGDSRFLVAHPRSAAHGLTFVNCHLQTFYSLDYSSEAYEQARARTHRAGQKNPCTYIHLVAKDSIDGEIMEVLKGKKDAQEILYSMMPNMGVAA